jgi:hypothetical protein
MILISLSVDELFLHYVLVFCFKTMNGIFLVWRRSKLDYSFLAVFFPIELIGVLFLVNIETLVAFPIVIISSVLLIDFPVGIA